MKTTETPTPSRRRSPIFWVPTAYFGMGLPFVVLNMVAVLMYKGLGVSDAKIAFWTSLIMLPWTLKPLWSPLLEMYRTKKFFVVLTQMVSGVTFGLIALSLHLPSFFAVTIALFAIVAFSGATHDVACDGVYMDELNAQEQAKYIGWQGAFYNVAKIIGTGLLVYLAGFLKDEYEGPAEDAVLYSWTVIMIILGVVDVRLGNLSYPYVTFGQARPFGHLFFAEYDRVMECHPELLYEKAYCLLHFALLFYIVLPKGL